MDPTDTSSAAETAPTPPRPAQTEWLAVFALLALFLVFHLATYNWYPTVWTDEVTFSDPAINLVKLGHFTTFTWQFQPANTFWAVNSPLYSLVLAGWLKVIGTSLLAVRSFNFVLIGLAAFLLWTVSWKWGLIKTMPQRLVLIPLLQLGYGVSFASRCSRPDILGLVSLLFLLLAFRIEIPRLRSLALLVLSGVTAWVGFQVSVFACVACAGAWIILRCVTWRDVLLVGLGAAGGAFLVMLFFAYHNALAYFLSSIFYIAGRHSKGALELLPKITRRIAVTLTAYFEDFSVFPLLFGLACFYLVGRRSFSPALKRLLLFVCALFVGVPLVFNFVGHFTTYYDYMLFVPITLGFVAAFSALSQLSPKARPGLMRLCFVLLILGSVSVGLPLRLLLTAAFSKVTPRAKLKRMIASQVHPGDVVFCDYAVYFETKQIANVVYTPMYARTFVELGVYGHEFTAEEKKGITVAIVHLDVRETLNQYFGGKWEPVSPPFGDSYSLGKFDRLPVLGSKLARYFSNAQNNHSQIQVLRRTSP